MLNNLIAGGFNIQGIALAVTAVAVTCFTVAFTLLFINYRKYAVQEINSGKQDIELIEEYIASRKKKSLKIKSALKVVKVILYTLLMAFITVCIVFTLFVRFSQNVPLGTKSFMVVASGSMSEKNPLNEYLVTNNLNDQFPTYSIIVLEKVDPSKLKQYDVVAYNHPSGRVYIHRIRAIEVDQSGKVTYRTRGDAVGADDQSDTGYNVVTGPEDIVGRYTGIYIPFLGAFVQFMQSPAGIVTIIALVFCLVMFDKNSSKISDSQEARTQYLIKLLDIENLDSGVELSAQFVEQIYLDKAPFVVREGDGNAILKELKEKLHLDRPNQDGDLQVQQSLENGQQVENSQESENGQESSDGGNVENAAETSEKGNQTDGQASEDGLNQVESEQVVTNEVNADEVVTDEVTAEEVVTSEVETDKAEKPTENSETLEE